MRINRSIAGGMLTVFAAVGAVTILPAASQTLQDTDATTVDELGSVEQITTARVETTTSTITAEPATAAASTPSTAADTPSTTTSTTSTSTTVPTPSTTTTTSQPTTTTTSQPTPTTTSQPTTTTTIENIAPVRTLAAQNLSERQFEELVEDEIYRLTNCARTGSSTWCLPADGSGWNVTDQERPLNALARNADLDVSSQAWSAHLVGHNEIFHSDDSGKLYGENVAYNPTLHTEYELTSANAADVAATLMQQWMDSPGHRSQLLYPDFESIGVGAAIVTSPPSPDTFVESWGTQQFQ